MISAAVRPIACIDIIASMHRRFNEAVSETESEYARARQPKTQERGRASRVNLRGDGNRLRLILVETEWAGCVFGFLSPSVA
jgi:hypothetical protein